jgi:hypothetical protein
VLFNHFVGAKTETSMRTGFVERIEHRQNQILRTFIRVVEGGQQRDIFGTNSRRDAKVLPTYLF